jgi:hypothetical protein
MKAFTRVDHKPIDGERIDVRLMNHIQPQGDTEQTNQRANAFAQRPLKQTDDDIVIRENKRYRGDPALNETEGTVV